ncbi:tetratricopeptide repeat protein [Nostoc sp.]|uniref:tetratricopeptide repeat protein n=1 Tax=Nostoc sp. TaxID=1180 RepID=UPI002FF9FC58
MNHIKRTIALLGITSVLSVMPAVYAQEAQIPLNRANFQDYYNQGVQKLEQGNFKGAMSDDKPLRVYADFDSVVRLNPRFYEGFCLRGLAKSQLKDFSAAITDFNLALRLNPNHIDAYNGRGISHVELGDFQKAIADFNQTVKIDPTSQDGYYNLGLAHFRQGNHQQVIPSDSFANANFNQALKINPNLADAYGNRGLAKYALGDSKSAITDLQEAARLFLKKGDTQAYQQTQALIQQVQR